MADLSIAEQAALLRGYLIGQVSRTQLTSRLASYLTISGVPPNFRIDYARPLEAAVVIAPRDLRPVLERYLAWTLPEEELIWWASLLLAIDYASPAGLTDDEADETMGPVWDLLSDLSILMLIEESGRERVSTGLGDIAEAQAKLDARARALVPRGNIRTG